ncbi:methionine/alanine import family NSS transporter small subunit [Kocuria tytonis]|uniref:Methionine/alanine import family NSS transporter small subunit n=1 Tax=Kocuria tytonis TaxID=2054280 RepID=A0A495AAW1_9MICC|nr:methionine/alanine import family NSS transporter small subunit [Kocuria tytonis]RKQ36992.1 methionine/alanine import family NSS transporter small subunit [Kocuria tytonis]
MSSTAVIMMVVAMVMVWGGLLLALVNIKRSPEEVDELDTPSDAEHAADRDGSASTAATAGTEPERDRV